MTLIAFKDLRKTHGKTAQFKWTLPTSQLEPSGARLYHWPTINDRGRDWVQKEEEKRKARTLKFFPHFPLISQLRRQES